MKFIPVITTAAGMVLTAQNIEDSKIQMVSCRLSDLLIKPGPDVLKKFDGLKQWIGWGKKVVLSCTSLPKMSKDRVYKFRSAFDGSLHQYTPEELCDVIQTLKPDYLTFPDDIESWDEAWVKRLQKSINCLFPTKLQATEDARHYYLQGSNEKEALYYHGRLDCNHLELLEKSSYQWYESEQPAEDAVRGRLYSTKGCIDVTNEIYVEDFSLIDSDCSCATCKQGFTKAYLHHLLAQTPLLSQRLLMQHNFCFLAKK